jgi:hypothetical protein
MSDTRTPSDDIQLTGADVARWEAEARTLREEAEELMLQVSLRTLKAAALADRAKTARELFALIQGDDQPMPANISPSAASTSSEEATLPPSPPRKGSWREAVQTWVHGADKGLSPGDLRALIAADKGFHEKFQASDKGFYHAIARLKKDGTIVRHGGRYYSPKAFSENAHLPPPEDGYEPLPAAEVYSPMGEAIQDIVSANPGIANKDIIKRLCTDVEFNATLTPHTSGAHNIIARLGRRGQIVRQDGGCYPGPRMTPRNPASKWAGPRTLSLVRGGAGVS